VADIVLDEDVYVFALESEGTDDLEYIASARLVTCLQQRHRWIVTPAINAAYRRQFARQRRPRGSVASGMMVSLDDVLFDAQRSLWINDAPEIEGPYDPSDRHVVAAAGAVRGAILVTSDGRLTDSLVAEQTAENHGFRVLDPFEALGEFCEST
jgi:hypothetical protein